MALITMNCYSKALKSKIVFNVILPEHKKKDPKVGAIEGPYQTLWLLHGLSSNHNDWLHKTAIERFADHYNIAVVMPNVGRSWYTDTAYGAGYFTLITKELPEICRSYFKGMSSKREDNIIAGFSMGGYGAVKAALTYPEQYKSCISLSGSLDITRKNRPVDLNEWKSIFGFELESALELENTEHDLFYLAKKNKEQNIKFPEMYLWCGTEDTLIHTNRDFHELLGRLEVEHRYLESEGTHSWKYWDVYFQEALKFVFEKE